MAIPKPWKPPNSDVWWFRRSVPQDVRKFIGKTEWRESLHTRDRREAQTKILSLIEKTTCQIEDARAGRFRRYDQARIDGLVLQWSLHFSGELRQSMWLDAVGTGADPLSDEITRPISTEEELEDSLEAFLGSLDWGDDSPILRGSADFEAMKELAFEWHYFAYVTHPEPGPLMQLKGSPLPEPMLSQESSLRLSAVADRFDREADARLSKADRDLAVRRFIDVCGNLSVKEITKADARKFKKQLEQIPVRIPAGVREQSVESQIAWAKEHDRPRLSSASVKKQLSMLRSLLTWAYKEAGLFDDVEAFENPFAVVTVTDSRTQEERRTGFSVDDLMKIFRLKSIVSPKRTEDRWLPLLALFTGARLEEIGQLLLSDVKQEDGILVLHLSEFDESGAKRKKLKTVGSRRMIPIHPTLLELGFHDYVESVRKKSGDRLFPTLAEGARGKVTSAFSKRINRHIREVVPDRRKTFHSFRHSFKAACQRAMIPEDVSQALMGHASRSVSLQVYGRGLPTMTDVLFDALRQIRYPGLDISHLRP